MGLRLASPAGPFASMAREVGRHELRTAGQARRPGGERPASSSSPPRYLDHGHIYGQCNGLIEAGRRRSSWVYDPDPKKAAAFQAKFPQARVARSLAEILRATRR
jgi:hypothetical protein